MSKRQSARGSILVKPKEAMETIAWSLWAHDLNPGAPRAVATEEGLKIAAPDEQSENIIRILAKGIADGDLPCRVLFQEKWVELDPPSEEFAAKLLVSGDLRIYRDPLFSFADKLASAGYGDVCRSKANKSPMKTSNVRTTTDQKNEIACGEWIKLSGEDCEMTTKDEMWKRAKDRWPGLRRRAFDRAWTQNAPESARSAGRPRKI